MNAGDDAKGDVEARGGVARIPQAIGERPDAFPPMVGGDNAAAQDAASIPPDTSPADTSPKPALDASYGGLRTREEMATIILNGLRTLDGAPRRGFVVTVYGYNPWNAMLTIKPEAASIANPALWYARVREMAARLREEYQLAD